MYRDNQNCVGKTESCWKESDEASPAEAASSVEDAVQLKKQVQPMRIVQPKLPV